MKDVFSLVLEGKSAQEIIDACEEYIGNPIAFIDKNQNEVLFSKNYPMDDLGDKLYRKHIISDQEYQKDTEYVTALSKTGKVHMLAWPNIRRKRIICGSVIGEKHLGGIRLPDVNIPLENLDQAKIEEVAKILGVVVLMNGVTNNNEIVDNQTLLLNLLNNHINYEFLLSEIVKFDIPKGEKLVLLYHLGGKPYLDSIPSSYAYTPYNNGFVYLCKYKDIEEKRIEIDKMFKKKQQFLVSSIPFVDIAQISKMYSYILKTIYYARMHKEETGLIYQEDYLINFFIHQDETIQKYMRDKLNDIYSYDKQKETDYIQTIQEYLKWNGDILLASEKLCIHKNTMIYRLEKIKNTFGIDLKNNKTLVEVFISLEMNAEKKESSYLEEDS